MSMPAASLTSAHNLASLLDGMAEAPPIALHGIASDSRRVAAGDLFLACRGDSAHALDYLDAGQASTLAAIAWDGDAAVSPPPGVPAVIVPGLKQCLGHIGNRWFDTPSATVRVAAVTGTNGKTTVAWLLAQCWQMLGRRCGYLGTLGAGIDEITERSGLTTPDCIEMHRLLAGFRDLGASDAAIEVSSHALAQGRIDGVTVDTALFTNLSRDHIDYHGDMAAYGESKAGLFLDYAPRLAVVCVDSEFGRTLAARCGTAAVQVASDAKANVNASRYVVARQTQLLAGGSRVAVHSSFGDGSLDLPLYGHYNVANALQVLAVLLCADVAIADALEVLHNVTAPPGRMELVNAANETRLPRVFVDYAHTPAALEAALQALRPHCDGRLLCVFGCGGDRDRGKRPLMGQAASSHADMAVLTSDNPRSEDPAAIMQDVERGMHGPVTAIEDRAAAIAFAIDHAASGDVVLVAGKGHEDYQQLADRRIDFSDRDVAAGILRRRAAS